MAQYTADISGSLTHFSRYLENFILDSSLSASLEETFRCRMGEVTCVVQTYERYSFLGGNRVSLSVTMLEHQGRIHLMAAATGGSQAMFFKINDFGETAFLEKLEQAVKEYASSKKR